VVQELDFNLVVLGAPVVKSSPASATVRIGQAATFTVSAIGATPLSYFWQLNGSLIPDANQTNYTFPNPQLTDSGGRFSCIVSNSYGTATSQVATLTVSASLVLNGDFETGNFTDWSESGNIEFTSVTTNFAHSGLYGAQLGPLGALGYISQTLPTVAGSNYLVSLWLENPGGQPNEFVVNWNGAVLFDGVNLPLLPWTNMQFIAYSPGTSSTLQIGFRNDPDYLGLDDIGAQLTGPAAPTITSQPASQTVTAGANVTLEVGVSGSGPLYYQWHFNNGILQNATNQTLTLNNIGPAQIGMYNLTVSNSLGSASSATAYLVFPPPNLIGNGGFETGGFTDWTLNGDPFENGVYSDPFYVRSGNFSANLGELGSMASLSQTVHTTNGQLYLLSAWLVNPFGGFGYDEFAVYWNSNVLFDHSYIETTGFTNLQFLVTATGPTSTVGFGAENDADYYGLDDVSLTLVPPPNFQGGSLSGNNFLLTWATSPGLRYQAQYSTTMTLGSWINLGNPFTAGDYTYTLNDPATTAHRFYRIVLLPVGNAAATPAKGSVSSGIP